MPQIGWFEILVVVVIAILVIGPKDFPAVVRKIGSIIGSIKRYFQEIQKDFTSFQESSEQEISLEDEIIEDKKNKKNNES